MSREEIKAVGWLLALVLSLIAGAFLAVNIILWRVV